MSTAPVVSTITPVLNDALDLELAVRSIVNQTVPIDRIVLAVGPSDDGSMTVAQTLAADDNRIVVVENPCGTTPSALNLALAECRSEFVARVDARSFLPRGYLASALDTLRSTGAANVGAIQVPVGTSLLQRSIAAAMRSKAGNGGVAYRGSPDKRPVDTAWLGVFRRSALTEVGGYDNRFRRNQDAELNWRLTRAGYEVWLDPALAVEYRPRRSLIGLARQYFQYGVWRCRTVKEHPGSLKLRHLAAPLIVVALIAASLLAFTHTSAALLVPLGYVTAVAIAAVAAADDSASSPFVMTALFVIHLSWGVGFLASSLMPWRRVVSDELDEVAEGDESDVG